MFLATHRTAHRSFGSLEGTTVPRRRGTGATGLHAPQVIHAAR